MIKTSRSATHKPVTLRVESPANKTELFWGSFEKGWAIFQFLRFMKRLYAADLFNDLGDNNFFGREQCRVRKRKSAVSVY